MELSVKEIDLYGDGIGKVSYVKHMGNDLDVVNAARVSFGINHQKLTPEDEKLINYLVRERHTSPFEHSAITFLFKVPMFVRSQHHRHRTWSYNEISRRYTAENIQFYIPQGGFRTQHSSNRQASNLNEVIDPFIIEQEENSLRVYENFCNDALRNYEAMLKIGICREQARGLLPQTTYTTYYGTVNLSNLLKFIDLRTHQGAQWEIQRVAEACKEIASQIWPVSFKAFERAVKA